MIAMGDHMPVHLGSMPMSVRAAIEKFVLKPGDVVMLNDPFRGGTHLPDITLVAPFYFSRKSRRPDFFVASRAHHADVGGAYPGSMGLCREIYQEGLRIPPVRIMRGGKMERDVLDLLLNNVRTPEEREGDLGAQMAACHTGAERLREVCARYGLAKAKHAAGDLLEYSEEMMRAFLTQVKPGTYRAEDFLDNDGISDRPVKISVAITFALSRETRARAPAPHGLGRLQWVFAAGRRIDQRRRGDYLLGMLLCFSLSVERRRAGYGGIDASHSSHHARRNCRKRASSCGGSRWERGDFAAYCGCAAARTGAGAA